MPSRSQFIKISFYLDHNIVQTLLDALFQKHKIKNSKILANRIRVRTKFCKLCFR